MMKILSFRLNGMLLGIETQFVKEINRNVEYTEVPLAPEKIVGLFNMRGQVVTLLNLAYYLGYEKTNDSPRNTCIILKTQGNRGQVGFLIDTMEDIFDIEDEQCEESPANSKGKVNRFMKCVAKLENELLLIIKNEAIFDYSWENNKEI